MKKLTVLMVGILMAGAIMAEMKLQPLPAIQAAMVTGSQVLEIAPADFTPTTADIAQTNTFTITGPAGLRFEGAKLEQAFDDGLGTATTNNITFTLKIDALTVVNAKQIASDQTHTDAVWIPGTFSSGSVTVAATNEATAVTFTASNYAVAAGGSTITVTTIVTPTGGSALNALKTGKIKAYFSKW